MSVRIEDKKTRWVKIRKAISLLEEKEVVAGITQNALAAGESVANYAAANEFGTSKIPARPFMRTAYDENEEKLLRAFLRGRNKLLDGSMSLDQLLNSMGMLMETVIKKQILSNMGPPNSPSTVYRKAKKSGMGVGPVRTRTLIDHGIMLNSITFEIRKLGETKE